MQRASLFCHLSRHAATATGIAAAADAAAATDIVSRAAAVSPAEASPEGRRCSPLLMLVLLRLQLSCAGDGQPDGDCSHQAA